MKRWVVLCWLLIASQTYAASDWGSVAKAIGVKGMEQGDSYQVLIPRTDLNVVVQGYPLDSANVLVSRLTFTPGPEGTSKKDRLEGRIFLLDSEVAPALAQAAKGGLEISALYSPFLDESPCLKCLRLRGEGPRSNLAWAAKMVISATGTPMAVATATPVATPAAGATPVAKPNAWGTVQDLLGPGEEKGQSLLYRWEGDGREASLAFQIHGNQTTAAGELAVPVGESKALVEEFLKRHIAVTAVLNGDSGGTQRSFVDFWVVGDKKKLAEDLKEILTQMGFLNS